jgi:hypothetical protein
MVFVLLLMMTAIAVLYRLGSISLWPAIAGMIAVLIALGFVLVGRFRHVSYLAKRIKELRAKWGGAMSLIVGLPTPVDQRYYFYLSRRDEFIIESRLYSEVIPLSEISYGLVLHGSTLLALNDLELMEVGRLPEKPALSYVRNWLRRHQAEQHCRLLLLWPTAEAKRQKTLGDIIVLIDGNQLGDLDGLLRRPEVALKTMVLGERIRKRTAKLKPADLKVPVVPDRGERATEPFMVGSLEKVREETDDD